MSRRTILALAVAGATAAAPAALAGEPAGTAPQPLGPEHFRLVIKDVEILDANGSVLERHHCEWTEPADDDRPCLTFSGDPQGIYRAIKRAGGDAATVATLVPDLQLDLLTRIRERADGTWLFRTEGTDGGRDVSRGHVCSADGRRCTPWEASGRRSARSAVRAAAARLKKRR